MENIMEWLTLILDILSIIGGSAVLAASPAAKVLKYLPVAKKVVDVVALNVGEAKNAK